MGAQCLLVHLFQNFGVVRKNSMIGSHQCIALATCKYMTARLRYILICASCLIETIIGLARVSCSRRGWPTAITTPLGGDMKWWTMIRSRSALLNFHCSLLQLTGAPTNYQRRPSSFSGSQQLRTNIYLGRVPVSYDRSRDFQSFEPHSRSIVSIRTHLCLRHSALRKPLLKVRQRLSINQHGHVFTGLPVCSRTTRYKCPSCK